MKDLTENIRLLHHSSIRIENGKQIIYVDPFEIEGEPHDADVILVTHEHFDHFSPADIDKIKKEGTRLVVPESMLDKARQVELLNGKIHGIRPGGVKETRKLVLYAVPAYNKHKHFHPKKNGWIGYRFIIDGYSIYIAGDTDLTDEAAQVKCDIALIPIGGKYTMNYRKAAELVNYIRPQVVIPTHYGSVAGKQELEDKFAPLIKSPIQVKIKMEKY